MYVSVMLQIYFCQSWFCTFAKPKVKDVVPLYLIYKSVITLKFTGRVKWSCFLLLFTVLAYIPPKLSVFDFLLGKFLTC